MNIPFIQHLQTTIKRERLYEFLTIKQEMYEFLSDWAVRGVTSFLIFNLFAYGVCSFLLYEAFTVRAHILFASSIVVFSVAIQIYKARFNQLVKTGTWVNSKNQLVLYFIVFILCGYIWWSAYTIYLLQHSHENAIFGFIASGMVAAFAINQFSAFIRVIALAFFFVIVCLILLVIFFSPSYDYHLYYWVILYVFEIALLGTQHRNMVVFYRIKNNNLDFMVQLKQKNQALEHANLMQARYLSAASHDLRQPLHALSLIANNLQRESHDAEPKKKNSLLHLNQAIESLSKSFDSMLNLSRLDSGVIKPKFQIHPLQQLFERLRIEYQSLATNKNLKLKITPTQVCVHTDDGMLYSILSNLVSNAIRYTEQGGILVGAQRRGNSVKICVCDTGVGIPTEKLKHIFNEYQRLEYAQERVTGGVGLGLAISERMAVLLKTRMTVVSREGKGSTFSIEIPIGESHNALATDPPILANSLCNKKVMVADDDAIAADNLAQMLESWGMKVTIVLSIEMLTEAMAEEGEYFDLVLSDYHLGLSEENGLELLKTACNLQPAQPPICILITGDTTIDLIDQSNKANIQLLHKPIRPARLRLLLNNLFAAIHENPTMNDI